MQSRGAELTKICAKLVRDEDFCALETNESRVSYVLKEVKSLQEFREEITQMANNYRENHGKSLKLSQKLRQEADNHMALKDFWSAIRLYSYAIVNAPFPTQGTECKELQKGYTSRSLAFGRVGHYSNALFDANKSLFLGTSLDMLSHKAFCLRFLGRYAEAKQVIDGILCSKDYYKLEEKPELLAQLQEQSEVVAKELFAYGDGYPKEEVERTSNYDMWKDERFEIKRSEEKGRHYVAKETIPADTIVMAEKPQLAVLSGENMYSFCTNCFKRIDYQYWPCVWCNEVVFCDRECHDRGIADFHQFDCKITGLLLQTPLYQTYRAVTRIGCEQAFKMATSDEPKEFDVEKWVQRFYGRDVLPVYRRRREEMIHHFEGLLSLVDHNQDFTSEENAKQTLMAIELALLMDNKKAFKWSDEKTFVSFVSVLIRVFRKCLTNGFGWSEANAYGPQCRSTVGTCVSLFGSLVNHNCLPNTKWEFFDNKLIFRTVKEIEAGEELTITYGPNPYMALTQRQMIMKSHYHFYCKCKFCLIQVQSYPALRCGQCEGPVLFVPIPGRLQQNSSECLQCGAEFLNIREVMNRSAELRLEFDQMLKKVEILSKNEEKAETQGSDANEEEDNYEEDTNESQIGGEEDTNESQIDDEEEYETECEDQIQSEKEDENPIDKEVEIDSCLSRAEESLQSLIGLHYKKCDQMFALIMRLSKAYVNSGKYSEAIKHFRPLISSIDWSKCAKTCKHLDDLLFITSAYYLYLKDQTTPEVPAKDQKKDWKQCFNSFSALKQSYKTIKAEPELTKSVTIDGKPLESIEKIKDVMREKKANFSALKDVYRRLFQI